MRRVGLHADAILSAPHITLCWGKRQLPGQSLPQPVHWTVDQFWLIETLVGKSRHIWRGDWPLQPGAIALPTSSSAPPSLF
jgi:2'-5' RNA ligase